MRKKSFPVYRIVYVDSYTKYFVLFKELIKMTGNNDFSSSKQIALQDLVMQFI